MMRPEGTTSKSSFKTFIISCLCYSTANEHDMDNNDLPRGKIKNNWIIALSETKGLISSCVSRMDQRKQRRQKFKDQHVKRTGNKTFSKHFDVLVTTAAKIIKRFKFH